MASMDSTVSGLVGRVESTPDFIAWQKANAGAYLASVFVMAKKVADLDGFANEWLLSYYDNDSDTFTTFSSIAGKKAEKEEAFKKGRSLPGLKLEAVKAQFPDAIREAEKLRLGKYKGEAPSSIVIVLQPLSASEIAGKGTGRKVAKSEAVWNITYITSAFNVLNVKVSAESGKVVHDSISGVMDFMQKDK